MVHKSSKSRSDPCSYRPISLLCCLSKVFEAIMTKLTRAVCQAQQLSRSVGANTSRYRKGIRQSLAQRLTLRTVTCERIRFAAQRISSFLRDRTVKVRILGHTSKEIAINYSVPQGSPISSGGGGGDSYIRGDRGAVSDGMLMDQTIRENMSKNRPKIPGKCRQCNQYDRMK